MEVCGAAEAAPELGGVGVLRHGCLALDRGQGGSLPGVSGPPVHTWAVTNVQRILVTGAAGKVGQAVIGRLLASGDDRFAGFTIRALCHNRMLSAGPRLEVMSGSIDQPETPGGR